MAESSSYSLKVQKNFILVVWVSREEALKGEVRKVVEDHLIKAFYGAEEDISKSTHRSKAWWLNILKIPTVLIHQVLKEILKWFPRVFDLITIIKFKVFV